MFCDKDTAGSMVASESRSSKDDDLCICDSAMFKGHCTEFKLDEELFLLNIGSSFFTGLLGWLLELVPRLRNGRWGKQGTLVESSILDLSSVLYMSSVASSVVTLGCDFGTTPKEFNLLYIWSDSNKLGTGLGDAPIPVAEARVLYMSPRSSGGEWNNLLAATGACLTAVESNVLYIFVSSVSAWDFWNFIICSDVALLGGGGRDLGFTVLASLSPSSEIDLDF